MDKLRNAQFEVTKAMEELSLSQQIVGCISTFFNLVDVEPRSKEQILRWAISAISYGVATYVVVKPSKEKSL